MLSTVRWINASGGDWDTPSNWVNTADPSDHHVPTASDDAQINLSGITVTHSSNASDSIHSLTSQATLMISAGSLAIAASSTVSNLDLSGTLTGEGDLTVTKTLNWTGGTMSGTGTTTVPANGTLNLLDLSGGLFLDGRTLVNAGIATWSGDFVFVANNGATIENLSTFTITGDGVFGEQNTAGAEPAFNNAGTLIKTGGSGVTGFFLCALNNSGSVQVQSGTLDLPHKGDSTGSFQVSAGATLRFGSNGGTQTLEPPSRISGAGTVLFENATANIQGTYDLGGTGTTQFTFGEAHFTGPVASLGKVLAMNGGIADFRSGAPVTVPELDLAAGILTGTDNVIVTGMLNWTGGIMSGVGKTTVAASAMANFSGALFLDSRTLVNAGSATWSTNGPNDHFDADNGATIDNLSGATFTITNDRTIGQTNVASAPVVFNNAGTLVKTGGTGVTLFWFAVVNNTGVMRAEQGTFQFHGEYLSIDGSGTLAGQPGTTLVFDGANLTGQTRNAGQFAPMPTVLFKSTGQLEAMSQDLGDTSAGFFQNFAYDTLQIGDPNGGASVTLVDDARNSASTGPEALYVNTLIVPQSNTLDLNGLHVYARSTQIAGTILHGSVSIAPPGGAIPLNASAPGDLTAGGQVNDWTFYGRAGQSVALSVHTGAGGTPTPPAPALNFALVTLLAPDGQVLATASNSQSGADAGIPATVLPVDGVYHIQVQAPAGQSSRTGNYVLSTYGSPLHEFSLALNQQVNGQLDTPVSVDSFDFSAMAGQHVQFHLVAASSPDIQFGLTGPGGYVGFTDLSADSPPLTLPSTGNYTLTAHVAGAQPGAYAFAMQTSPIDLTLGTPYHGTLAGSGQTQLFRVQLPTASPLQVGLSDSQSADQNEVYVKLGAPPTRADYDDRFSTPASANQVVTVPQAAPGTWYILVYSAVVPASGSYTLRAAASSIFLRQVSPTELGTVRDNTLTLAGAGFDRTTTVDLVASNGTMFPAHSVNLASPTSLTATFLAGTVPAGVYSVRIAKSDGGSSELSNVFTVVQGGQAHLETNLIVPSRLAVHFIPATIEIDYSNTGTDAMPAPLLLLTATQGSHQAAFLTLDSTIVHSGIYNLAVPDGFTTSIQLLASGATPGLLQPGESIQVPVYWAGWLESEWDPNQPIVFHLSSLEADDPRPIDWDSLKDRLRPSTIAVNVWDALYPNLVSQIGSTWGQYVTRMDADAAYLAGLGETVTDLSRLLVFEIQEANGFSPVRDLVAAADASLPAPGLSLNVDRTFSNSMIGRNQIGPFGRGWWWSDGWQRTLSVLGNGTVVISDGNGLQHRFQPDQRGGYFDQPGDHATLTQLATGVYTLTETNGLVTTCRSDGTIEYVQDTNGNRITAGYTNGLLTSLTHSSGQSFQIIYNSAGRIETITDPASGRSTTYTYDASDEHLMTVTTFGQRTTTYTYDLGANPATANALLSVTGPAGTHDFFAYDTRGGLSDTHRDGGAEDVTYSYSPAGAVAATAANGATTTYSFDDEGLLARSEDPLHQVTHYSHFSDRNLTQVMDPAGRSYSYLYDARGNLIRVTDPLGHAVSFAYSGPFSRVTSSTDENGNTTLYGYDPSGNETSTTYADGSAERMAYDALGDLKTLTNRRGNPITFQYDTSGRLTTETLADGTQMTYHHDARGNLTSTTDPSGTTTFIYDDIDQLKEIDYPGGLFLKYSYDAASRRSRMVDQTGFTVNYTYDAVGRLWKLTDGNDTLIDQYTFYDTGRLKREDKGNGTFTTYEYDPAGELLHLVNHAPDGSVNSRFDYTYNELGRVATETTLDGQWTYTYDAIGELTHAVFASNNPAAIPNQDLQYIYDPAGNRTRTIINGVRTDYVSNKLNQYTSIGNATLNYDADGNLISRIEGSQSPTYTFNDLNQLVAASTPAGTFTAQYDALGFRIATGLNGQTSRYVVDAKGLDYVVGLSLCPSCYNSGHVADPTSLGNVVGMYNTNDGLIAHFLQGAGLISRVETGGASSYYDFDALGSTAGLSGQTGRYQDHYSYVPFGGLLAASEAILNPFQFGGQVGIMQDPTGLDYMRARSYAPTDGQFTSEDPLRLYGVLTNRRSYSSNDPINGLDPSGKFSGFGAAVWGTAGAECAIAGAISFGTGLAVCAVVGVVAGGVEEKDVPDLTPSYTVTGPFRPGEPGGPRQPCYAYGGGLAAVQEEVECPPIHLNPPPDWFEPPYGPGPDDPSRPAGSFDPNDKIGPAGYGPQGFIAPDGALPYRIDFENEATAGAPAQRVIVTDQLDPSFDWKTFALTGVGFGDTDIAIPAGSQHYQTTVDITENSQAIEVDIELGLNPQTGLITATFQTIDPRTQLPPDVLTGFLPPEDGTGRGKGYFTYLVQLKAGLPTGMAIRNVATVIFDANAPITTDQVDPHDATKGIDPAKQDLITIDAGPPTSTVAPLPATETSANFTVSWSGQDDPGGSGIATYDIYVSDNGGPFVPFLTGTAQTAATFHGVNGHTYAFYSVATDNVGHVEATSPAPEATTRIHITVGDVSVLVASSAPESQYGQALTFTATVNPLTPGLPTPGGTVQFQIDGAPFGAPVDLIGGQAASPSIATLSAGRHSITALYANDPNYRSNSASASETVDQAHLTIAADAKSMISGSAVPALTYTITGFVNGDGPSSLTSPVVLSTTVTAGSPPGVYPIMVGGAASPNYAITFVAGTLTVIAPPLVTMTNVQEVFKKRHQVIQVIVDFSGPVNSGQADTLATYRLTIAGKHGSFTAKEARTIVLASAVYNGSTDSVTLVPKKSFGLTRPVQLRVSGQPPKGLSDKFGRLIDGNHDGQPGGDAVAVLSKPGVRIEARRQPGTLPRLSVPAVDHLLSTGSRERLLHSLVTAALGGGLSNSAAPQSGRDDPAAGRLITIVDPAVQGANGGPGNKHRVPLPARSEATRLESTRFPAVGPVLRRRAPTKRTSNRFPDPKSDRPAD
jgi:RHS repeat-associated protein